MVLPAKVSAAFQSKEAFLDAIRVPEAPEGQVTVGHGRWSNRDLEPTPPEERTWKWYVQAIQSIANHEITNSHTQVRSRHVLVHRRLRYDRLERRRLFDRHWHDMAANLHFQCPGLLHLRTHGHGHGASGCAVPSRLPGSLPFRHGHVRIVLLHLHQRCCLHYLVWCPNSESLPLVETAEEAGLTFETVLRCKLT